MLLLAMTFVLPTVYFFMNHVLSDVGIVKCRKGKLAVKTSNIGIITLPQIALPSYDWDVIFFTEKSGFNEQDGLHDSSVIDNFRGIRPMMVRNMLICQYLYSDDLGKGVKCVINSPFDDICYVRTLEAGEMINYRSYCDDFATKIEQM